MARPVNDRLHDVLTDRQVDLIRVSNGETAKLTSGVMRSADDRIVARLSQVEGTLTAKQLAKLEERLRNTLAVQERQMRKALQAYVSNIASSDLDLIGETMARALAPLGIEPKPGTTGGAVARARSTPVRGVPMSRMFARLFRNDRERVLAQVRQGIGDGLTGPALGRSVVGTKSRRFLDGVRQVSRRGLDTMLQTVTTHVATAARSVFVAANPNIIRQERWVSTLDGKTSDICQALDGRVFPVGEGIHPPAHPNCRSARMPIIPGLEALPVDPSVQDILPATVADSFDGKGPKVLTYDKWLRGRPAAQQREILGPTRFALFKTGDIELSGFVNDRGTTRTLDELRKRNKILFDMAGLND